MYYLSSENKGADQLRSAPLFSPMQIVGFPMWRLIFCRSYCGTWTNMYFDIFQHTCLVVNESHRNINPLVPGPLPPPDPCPGETGTNAGRQSYTQV